MRALWLIVFFGCGGRPVDVPEDAHHCGGVDCLAYPGVQAAECVDGKCDLYCQDYRLDCDGNPGCETPAYSAENCGKCGVKCAGECVLDESGWHC